MYSIIQLIHITNFSVMSLYMPHTTDHLILKPCLLQIKRGVDQLQPIFEYF